VLSIAANFVQSYVKRAQSIWLADADELTVINNNTNVRQVYVEQQRNNALKRLFLLREARFVVVCLCFDFLILNCLNLHSRSTIVDYDLKHSLRTFFTGITSLIYCSYRKNNNIFYTLFLHR
jgi:hypothetical protein